MSDGAAPVQAARGVLAGASGRDGGGGGALAALVAAVAFILYSHLLVYALAFRGRDWRAM